MDTIAIKSSCSVYKDGALLFIFRMGRQNVGCGRSKHFKKSS